MTARRTSPSGSGRRAARRIATCSARSTVDDDLRWFVRGLQGPVWVTDIHGILVSVNAEARALLGEGAEPGAPCHAAVRGFTDAGRAVCGPTCAVREDAVACRAQRAWRLHVGDPLDEDAWVLVVVMPWVAAAASDAPPDDASAHAPTHLVHRAVNLSRDQRLREYVRRVASRSASSGPGGGRALDALTRREREVLDLLARDIDPQAIAVHLNLSYTTVRNHVQHILNRLDAHSTEEAVARWLLDG